MRFKLSVFMLVIFALLIGQHQQHISRAQSPNYAVYVPDSIDAAESESVPLIVALHPFGSSGRAMEALTGLDDIADERGFMVAYPNSGDYFWNDGILAAGYPENRAAYDDADSITTMLNELTAAYNIDPARIYLTGFGYGGRMAYYLACHMPERFAAAAVVGAVMWQYQMSDCQSSSTPLPLLLVMGSEDYESELTFGFQHFAALSVPDTLDFWQSHNGCDADSTSINDNVQVYENCAATPPTTFYEIRGGGHAWSRGDTTLDNFGVDVSDIITAYFLGDDLPPQSAPYEGVTRSYDYFVPSNYDASTPTPLVVALHGRPGNGDFAAYQFDFNTVAEQNGFIVVYPDGVDYEWNSGKDVRGFTQKETDDIAFFRAMIDDLALDLNIDRGRVYVAGFSNGGFMALRMACSAPDTFAAFAVVSAATLPPGYIEICDGTPPIPLLLMHGTLDTVIPFAGDTQMGLSVLDTTAFMANHNNCTQELETESLPVSGSSPGTQVHRFAYPDCANGTEVTLYAIDGGGHNIPGVPGAFGDDAGNVNVDIHAADVIWQFFARHSQ